MKKCYILFFTSLCFLASVNAKTQKQRQARKVTQEVFGNAGAQLKMDQQIEIESLIHELLLLSPYQKMVVAQKAAALLDTLGHNYKAQLLADKTNAPAILHDLFIVHAQRNGLQKFAKKLQTKLAWHEKLWQMGQHWFSDTSLSKIADQVFDYAAIEREHVFENYKKTQLLLAIQKRTPFPDLLRFWTDERIESILLKKINKNAPKLKLQEGEVAMLGEEAVEATADAFMGAVGEAATEIGQTTLLQNAKEAMLEVWQALSAQSFKDTMIDLLNTLFTTTAETTAEESTEEVVIESVVNTMIDDVTTEAEETTVNTTADILENEAEDIGEDAAEDTGGETGKDGETTDGTKDDPEEEPKKTAKDRLKEIKEKREAENKELQEIADGKKKGILNRFRRLRAKITLKFRAFKQFTGLQNLADQFEARISGPVNDWYKTHIYEEYLESMEDNYINQELNKLPPWQKNVIMMGFQTSIQQANGMIDYWISQDMEALFATYAKQNAQEGALSRNLGADIAQQKSTKLKSGYQGLNSATNTVSVARANITNLAMFEKVYREQNTINALPYSYFTVDQKSTLAGTSKTETVMESDERFAQSVMLTPESITTPVPTSLPSENQLYASGPHSGKWYNLFRSGNWEFLTDDQDNGIFYQTQSVKLYGVNTTETATKALYNTIFREYIPEQADSYTYIVDCTLLSHEDPFFMGVIFNQARWISGVPDRYHQHRFTGLFGQSGNIFKVFAESVNQTTNPKTAWPALRILNNPADFTQGQTSLTVTEPETFRFTITTKATLVSITIDPLVNGAAPATTSTPITNKNDLNPFVFSFHGIGFMAAGCVAQFKIVSPTNLAYTPTQIAQFKSSLTT